MGALGKMIESYTDSIGYDISDRSIAKKLGVTGQTVGNWRKGSALPSKENLRALANLLGAKYDAVLDAALMDAGYRSPAAAKASARKVSADKTDRYLELMGVRPDLSDEPGTDQTKRRA